MRKLILTYIFFLFSAMAFCQWAPLGAKWYYNHYAGASPYLSVIESIKDTIILSKSCKVLKAYTLYVAGTSPGVYHWDTLHCQDQYTYEENNKIIKIHS